MANVDQELQILATARYGADVRGAIINSITAMNEESEGAISAAQTSQTSCTASAAQALGYKNDTQQLKTDVQGLKTDCQTIKGQCTEEKTAAQTAATAAAASQSAAATSATNAASSENNASASASAASTSATNASASATSAAGSASAASQSATDAAASATAAAASQSAAGTSATSASNSATAASGSASDAQTYAGNAYSSATNAANSASAASSSAGSASGKASEAAASATAAANSASAAATSANELSNVCDGLFVSFLTRFAKNPAGQASFFSIENKTLLDLVKEVLFHPAGIIDFDTGFCMPPTGLSHESFYDRITKQWSYDHTLTHPQDMTEFFKAYDSDDYTVYKCAMSGPMMVRTWPEDTHNYRAAPTAGELEQGCFIFDLVVLESNATTLVPSPTALAGDVYKVYVDTTDAEAVPQVTLFGPYRPAT